MIAEKIRSLFRTPSGPPLGESVPHGFDLGRPIRARRSVQPVEMERQSNGLRQFFENLRGGGRLRILDLGGATQANINFITLLGYKLYTEDLMVGLQNLPATQDHGRGRNGLAARFVQENLDFPAEQFDGILVWDALEFLEEEILAPAVSRMQTILKPGGSILTFFHTHAKGETVPVYRYQIRDHQTLHLQPRVCRPLSRAFNNRNLERLFGSFRTVKFFLAKDGLREVIVTR